MKKPAIRLKKSGGMAEFPSPPEMARLRREFEERLVVRLPGFLAPDLLDVAQSAIASDPFNGVDTGPGARISVMENTRFDWTFTLLLSDPGLLRFVGLLTGRTIKGFQGRCFKSVPGKGDYLHWHNDFNAAAERLVGLSVTIGPGRFRGARFELRRRGGDQEPCASFANSRPGDAFLFRLGERLEHRNTPLLGTVPKTAFSGWFLVEPFTSAMPEKPAPEFER